MLLSFVVHRVVLVIRKKAILTSVAKTQSKQNDFVFDIRHKMVDPCGIYSITRSWVTSNIKTKQIQK
jgi:hypothetical protein